MRAAAALLCAALLGLAAAPVARGDASDPLFAFVPTPEPPPVPLIPPPDGYLNGPCGLAVDSGGRFYVSDYYHHTVDVYSGRTGYVTQLAGVASTDGPCALALDSADHLYVEDYHRRVLRYGAAPSFGSGATIAGAGVDASQPTGIAVDPATNRVYVDARSHVSVYEPSGAPVEEGGEPLRIGEGTLADGYGLAVSAYPATAGRLYVPDAATNTVKAYDPSTSKADPVQTIAGPPGGFASLRKSAVAVDRTSGEVYVLDDTQPADTEQPRSRVDVFAADGTYEGHLKYDVVDGAPSGLAVDNSAGATQGRVYVSSGNTHRAGIYAYPPGAATTSAPLAPSIPRPPLGAAQIFPLIPIGGPAPGGGGTEIACEGDACQILPPEPVDPTLTTLLPGRGNPPVRYQRRHHKHRRRHRRHGARGARASVSSAATNSAAAGSAAAGGAAEAEAPPGGQASSSSSSSLSLLPGAEGFDARLLADGGAAATLAGSHPYRLDFTLGLDQGGGEADLRDLTIELPAGLLADPAATALCSAAQLATPRSSPFEASLSGESCPARSQLGTLEVQSGLGPPRRFGLFNLEPAPGTALQLGASPYGVPLLFDAQIGLGAQGARLTLQATDVPQSLELHGLELSLWGTPWDASHNGERGNCLNEAEPAFPWARCSVGEPLDNPPIAFLTLPTACSPTLAFGAGVQSWQEPGEATAQALNRDSGGNPVGVSDCAALHFEPRAEGFLSTKKASSASGFVFRFSDEDPGLLNPRARARSLARGAVVRLPAGVTLNPSLGAGLGVCTPAQYAAESATTPPGAGCPDAAKIGDFSVRIPFYKGLLEGAIYLAAPHQNPFGSLLAVYLVAKAADRGIVVKAPGKLTPDPSDGTLTASFDELPQLPYTDLEVNFRSGQRAPLVSPDACGAATTRISMTPWAQGAPEVAAASDSPIESGIEAGPCPDGSTPPFHPHATAGGVNSNANSYPPYFVHLSRSDSEQEITSYSLVLPRGITGKLAGIPFCPDQAIEAARANSGFAETEHPSCPAASQVGRTLSGYGVGQALTYSPGRIYLAGPYHGAPLSLVTIDAATVGPFDLGTVVIRLAFALDPLTAQLGIDARASDPIPHILDGVPLHLRDIRVYMDRPDFTHNPSSCEASELVSTLTGAGARLGDPADDSTATATSYFQLLNCRNLGFQPKLGLRLRGGTRRGAYPELRASFLARGPRDSNLKQIAVTMPRSEFFAQEHIDTVCTLPQFETESCPPGSVYGRAVASTPLFDTPLRGPVYLRSNPEHELPDLVASLHSGAVHIVLEGRIGPARSGGIRTMFTGLPDAPIKRFTMTLFGGRRGLLVNSTDICAAPPLASVKALGQNNIGAVFTAKLRGQCRKRHHR